MTKESAASKPFAYRLVLLSLCWFASASLATIIITSHVCLSFCHSFVLSTNLRPNISETRPDSGMVTMDGLYKLAYGLSIAPAPDDVT